MYEEGQPDGESGADAAIHCTDMSMIDESSCSAFARRRNSDPASDYGRQLIYARLRNGIVGREAAESQKAVVAQAGRPMAFSLKKAARDRGLLDRKASSQSRWSRRSLQLCPCDGSKVPLSCAL